MVAFRNANTMRVLIGLIYHLVIEYTKKESLIVLVRPAQWRSVCKIKGRTRSEYKNNAIIYIKEKFGLDVTDDEADAIGIAEYGLSLNVEE